MARIARFRMLLPIIQCGLTLLFGGIGLSQRIRILNGPFIDGQSLWDTTATYHVWPWPLKFAVASNLPALAASVLFFYPFQRLVPGPHPFLDIFMVLLFVALLWYWVGAHADRRWTRNDKLPWFAFFIFVLVCLAGAFLPLGPTGYVPYALMVWVLYSFLECKFLRRLN